MRVLFASTGGSGHFNPLVPFIDACTARGDDVLVVAAPRLEATLAAREHPYRISGELKEDELRRARARVLELSRDDGAALMIREVFGRLGVAAMLPALEEACREWRPDLVLHEACEFASVVAAGRQGIPHARVAVSAARFTGSMDELLRPVLAPYGPGIVERLRTSTYLTRLPASLDPSPYAVTHRYHETPEPGVLPDWWGGAEDPLVYLTLGTEAGALATATGLYRAVLEAVSELPVRVLLTAGRGTDLSGLGPFPPNVHAEAWVPQADVLSRASLVVCHGGSGTAFGTLAAGVPLVCVPLFADQPTNARLVTEAGAGLAVASTDVPVGGAPVLDTEAISRIRSAVELVLKEPSYRARAENLGHETRATATCGELIDTLDPRT
ncbi:glycosyltransferase [Streptomyces sp. NPDC015032]|uniref:glycosyltransferase n=1 Tax=Streptomyces sp. NPDC015032 TaxID=3364937 RepID=UPI0036FFA6C9